MKRPARLTRRPIHLDFTPMTALGFMLICFFQTAEMLQKDHVFPLAEPEPKPGISCYAAVKNGKILTLLCAPGKVYFYHGWDDPTLDSTDYSPSGLRQVILLKKRSAEEQFGLEEYDWKGRKYACSHTIILIKPTDSATYGNVVDVLDEMRVCGIRHFSLKSISEQEADFIKNPGLGLWRGSR